MFSLSYLKIENDIEISSEEEKIKKLGKTVSENDLKRLEKLKKDNEYILKNIENLEIDFIEVLSFLMRFHGTIPFNHRIEIRCLPIKEDDKVKSIDLYGYGITNQAKLLRLFKSLNLKEYNIYYSLYKYELTDTKRRRINKNNSRCVSFLAWDFDKITEEKMQKLYKFCTNKGIFPVVLNSGFGYHFLFQLDGNYFDTNLLELFNKLGQELGLEVDPAVKDSARILRLPYTYNCKKVLDLDGVVDYSKAILCEIIESCRSIHSANNLFEVFGGVYTGEKTEEEVLIKGERNNFLIVLKETVEKRYVGCLKSIDLPTNILNMLVTGAAKGYRNESIMYLIYFFRNYLKYNKTDLKRIILRWNNFCRPSYDSALIDQTFERLYKSNYGCKYSKKLIDVFGKKDNKSYIDIKKAVKKVAKRDVVIPNKLFLKTSKLQHTSIKVFLYFLVAKDSFKLGNNYMDYIVKDKLSSLCGISSRTLADSLKKLKKNQLLSCSVITKELLKELKESGHKVNGNTQVVCLDKSVFANGLNYTNLDKDILEMALTELDSTTLVLFVYLISQLKRLDKNFNLSQSTVGRNLNMSQSTVSRCYKKLFELGYIKQFVYAGEKHYEDTSFKKLAEKKKSTKNKNDENVFFKIADENLVKSIVLDFD